MRYLPEKNLLFLHIPKTGGCAVERVIDNRWRKAIPHVRDGGPDRHVRRKDLAGFDWEPKVSAFIFVRHPVDWYVSCFRHLHQMDNLRARRRKSRRGKGMHPLDCLDWHPQKWLSSILVPDFDVWMNRIFNDQPGFLSKLFEEYIGFDEKNPYVDYVGRQETLDDDIERLLGIPKVPYVGTSRTKTPNITEGFVNSVKELERPVIDRYYGSKTTYFRRIEDWDK